MLWKSRGARPHRRGGQRRHSVTENSRTESEHSAAQDGALDTSSNVGQPGENESAEPTSIDSPRPDTALLRAPVEEPDLQRAGTARRPTVQARKVRPFSLMKFRHASDPQLSTTFVATGVPREAQLPTPTIITTSPTSHLNEETSRPKSKRNLFSRIQESSWPSPKRSEEARVHPRSPLSSVERISTPPSAEFDSNNSTGHVSFEPSVRSAFARLPGAPPAYGDESSSSLAIPISRLSESSRSEASMGDPRIYAQTTTTHTISTTTTLFRIPKRRKTRRPLFPLPARIGTPDTGPSSAISTPIEPLSGRTSISPQRKRPLTAYLDTRPETLNQQATIPSPTHSSLALTNTPVESPRPNIFRKESSTSHRSGTSTPSLQVPPVVIGRRGRSSTMGSLGKSAELRDSPTQLTASGRTSTSTTGRKSFGDLFSFSHRLRQNSEPPPRHGSTAPTTPGSTGSNSTSLHIPREMVFPERADEDTPASYLAKLEAAVPRGFIATVLCKGSDEFSKTCLRKYMRGFSYFTESIDMAIRKMLMEVELPKETQQIDRLLQGFADRYCECNPGIFVSIDEAYFVAFSILLLHSDTHNKNNKRKMQKQDYVRNTQDQVEVSHDILEYFYDNVAYTPFIHFEDEVAVNSHRLAAPKSRMAIFRTPSTDNLRGPVDPYTLILDGKLGVLRPALKDVMDTEDNYSAVGTARQFDSTSLHHAFFRSGVLQIVSARSRPDAFATQATISNPAEAQAGLVDIKAAKVGLLWRKEPKKKKTKSPWQEWGAILTSSQLYFFKDVHWIKKLISQYEAHQKQKLDPNPVVYKPPLTSFEPDALISMDDAVALLDAGYKKHKNAFLFVKHGGFEEVFLANDDADMNDWIAKLNYAATFRTAGVRMRGHMGSPYEGLQDQTSQVASPVSDFTASLTLTPVYNPEYRHHTHHLEEVMAYRTQIMEEKISDAGEKLQIAQKELDGLLRNARHLQVLTPVQARTREALILAAGRMSAKLKWTRVEMWRTKCHRHILRLDLDQGAKAAGPALSVTSSASLSTAKKTTPLRLSHQSLSKSDSRISEPPTSPKQPSINQKSRVASLTLTPQMKQVDQDTVQTPGHKSIASMELPSAPEQPGAEVIHLTTSSPRSHSLAHQASISSRRCPSNPDSRLATPTHGLDGGEEQVLREAGLLDSNTPAPPAKCPDTSNSDRDRVGAISPIEHVTRERGGSVRRSLHRTLRDPHHSPHLPQHHRSKKGRDSGSSIGLTEDGRRPSIKGESDGLTRGTGSFIVHGKKASVITFGSEWAAMSNEDRLKLRSHPYPGEQEEAVIDETTGLDGAEREDDIPEPRTRTNSTVTASSAPRARAEESDEVAEPDMVAPPEQKDIAEALISAHSIAAGPMNQFEDARED